MTRGLAAVLLAVMAATPGMVSYGQGDKLPGSGAQAKLAAGRAGDTALGLPPVPSASQSTIFGGAIRNIDPLDDAFMLDIYGQRPMKILYDERTRVFRNGEQVPVRDLGPADHASVQTALDGDHIFAMSIHILSHVPTGSYSGRVVKYDGSSGLLELDASPSPQPIKIEVPRSTTFTRTGQTAFASQPSGAWDLKPGALVSVTFAPGGEGHAIASHVVVLAVPGTSFDFTGNITALDMATGTLTLDDPRDQKSYQLSFYPGEILPSQPLRVGERVRITARFDGRNYMASHIRPY